MVCCACSWCKNRYTACSGGAGLTLKLGLNFALHTMIQQICRLSLARSRAQPKTARPCRVCVERVNARDAAGRLKGGDAPCTRQRERWWRRTEYTKLNKACLCARAALYCRLDGIHVRYCVHRERVFESIYSACRARTQSARVVRAAIE